MSGWSAVRWPRSPSWRPTDSSRPASRAGDRAARAAASASGRPRLATAAALLGSAARWLVNPLAALAGSLRAAAAVGALLHL